ncbi:MAG: WHG domain-containing protein, partial [Pseudonocardia sp.]|nr:WHG domain-containing protein [Pseudonocardia sp.]
RPADPDAPLAVAVAIWARVHGVVSLELRGHLGDLVGPADELFAAEIEHAVRLAS